MKAKILKNKSIHDFRKSAHLYLCSHVVYFHARFIPVHLFFNTFSTFRKSIAPRILYRIPVIFPYPVICFSTQNLRQYFMLLYHVIYQSSPKIYISMYIIFISMACFAVCFIRLKFPCKTGTFLLFVTRFFRLACCHPSAYTTL